MKKLFLLSVFAFVLSAGVSFADEAKAGAEAAAKSEAAGADPEAIEVAKKLFEVTRMREVMEESMEMGLEGQMAQFGKMGLSPAAIAELKAEMMLFLSEVMDYDSLEPEMLEMYAEEFTASEMEELIAFYETPIGMKSVEKTPMLMAKGMSLGQSRVLARSSELQQRIMPIIQKHMQQ